MTAPKGGRNAFMFVLVTVMLDMIGFGLIMPVTPRLLAELSGLSLEEAAPWGGYLATVYAVLNFLAGPILGNLSDRFGRRPVLLGGMVTLGSNFLLMGLAPAMWVLFVGRVLSGIGGATFATAQAYIADVTEPERRGQAFGMVGAAFGVGFIIGPMLGGALGEIDTRAPFFVAAGLSLLNFLYGALVLPESLAPENRRKFDWSRANAFGALRHLRTLPGVSSLLVTAGLLQFSQMLFPVCWAFFTEVRFGWHAHEIGISLGLVGVSAALVQGGLIRVFLARFGPVRTGVIGMVGGVTALVMYAFATEGWMVYGIVFLGALSGMAAPATSAIASSRVDPSAQGELQGATASVNALATILSPLVMTQTFSYFTREGAPIWFPGAPFLVAAAALGLALVPFLVGARSGSVPGRVAPATSSGET